jgi:tRNA uridine 5-carboxymethylaminomethyl modification enzyme
VRATRAQADRVLYKAAIRRRLENQPNLWLFQQAVDDLTVVGDRVTGVVTQIGLRFEARAVVLTAGTFLDGRIHVGLQNYAAGRAGRPAGDLAVGAAQGAEAAAGPPEDRHAAALDARTIDFSVMRSSRATTRCRCSASSAMQRAAPAPAAVLDHAHQRAHARRSSAPARPLARCSPA